MGTWGNGPFDSDSAADFASDIHGLTTPEARSQHLLKALREGADCLRAGHTLSNEYAWGWQLEFAVAAAAFVADEHTGVKNFTDTVYAKDEDGKGDFTVYAEIGTPSPELLDAARKFTARMLQRMGHDRIDKEWTEPVAEIDRALWGSR